MTTEILQHAADGSRYRDLQKRWADRAEQLAGDGASNLARVCAETARTMGRRARETERLVKGCGRSLAVAPPAFVFSDFVDALLDMVSRFAVAHPFTTVVVAGVVVFSIAVAYVGNIRAALRD